MEMNNIQHELMFSLGLINTERRMKGFPESEMLEYSYKFGIESSIRGIPSSYSILIHTAEGDSIYRGAIVLDVTNSLELSYNALRDMDTILADDAHLHMMKYGAVSMQNLRKNTGKCVTNIMYESKTLYWPISNEDGDDEEDE